MRLWEWIKRGWDSYTEYAHFELMAYLPAWDVGETDGEAGRLMYNEDQDGSGQP